MTSIRPLVATLVLAVVAAGCDVAPRQSEVASGRADTTSSSAPAATAPAGTTGITEPSSTTTLSAPPVTTAGAPAPGGVTSTTGPRRQTPPSTKPRSATPVPTTTPRPPARSTLVLYEQESEDRADPFQTVVQDIATGAKERIAAAQLPSWSPDRSMIAYQDDRGQIWLHARGTGERRLLTSGRVPAFSPDGRRVAFADGAGVVSVIGVDGTGLATVVDRSSPGITSPLSWSPDGRRLTFSMHPQSLSEGSIFVADADGGGFVQFGRGGQSPVWSPDGTSIAYVGQTNDGRSILTVVQPDGADPTLLPLPTGSGISTERPVWAPDSRSLVTTVSAAVAGAPPGATLTRFLLPTPENWDSQTATIGLAGDVDAPAWASSSDGSLIAYGGRCGTTTPHQLCVVDTNTGTVRSLDLKGPYPWSVSFAP